MKTIILFFLLAITINAQSEFMLLMNSETGLAPYPLTADLVASYDENEMTVSSWADQTGTNDFTQSTAGLQPILTADAINGYPGLLFDGADNYMQSDAFAYIDQPYTIYFVSKMASWTDGDKLLTASLGGWFIAEGGGGTNVYMYGGDYQPIRSFGVNEYKIASCVFNGASSVFQVNDDVATGNPSTAQWGGVFYLASGETGSNNANMEYVAIYVHSTAHDLATRTEIINWLNTKYGVY